MIYPSPEKCEYSLPLAWQSLGLLLLYEDDMVLLLYFCVGFLRLFDKSAEYLRANKFEMNYTKSKIMLFANKW